jgi:hypothetical protein
MPNQRDLPSGDQQALTGNIIAGSDPDIVGKQVLAYCIHRSGSNIFGCQLEWICQQLGIPFYSSNHVETMDEIKRLRWRGAIDRHTGCFGPIRPKEANPCIPLNLDPYNLLLQARDPRDVLTSLYYALVYVFPLDPGGYPKPEQQEAWRTSGIDSFVLEMSGDIRARYSYLLESEVFPKAALLRYEEMVTDHAAWAAKVLGAFKGHANDAQLAALGSRLLVQFAGAFDTDCENVMAHKRQVAPGDFRRKLSPPVIRELDRQFADILDQLNYPKG